MPQHLWHIYGDSRRFCVACEVRQIKKCTESLFPGHSPLPSPESHKYGRCSGSRSPPPLSCRDIASGDGRRPAIGARRVRGEKPYDQSRPASAGERHPGFAQRDQCCPIITRGNSPSRVSAQRELDGCRRSKFPIDRRLAAGSFIQDFRTPPAPETLQESCRSAFGRRPRNADV
jgi:hypothetical protein